MLKNEEVSAKAGGALQRNTAEDLKPILPQNEKGIVSDAEFAGHREKLVERSKTLFWWTSISRVCNMIAMPLLTAGMGLLIGCLTMNPTGLMVSQMWAIGSLLGVSALCLSAGIASDYVENLVLENQTIDTQEIGWKRQATSMARAFSEIGTEKLPAEAAAKPGLAQKLRPQAEAATWEEKTRVDPQSPSSSITINIS